MVIVQGIVFSCVKVVNTWKIYNWKLFSMVTSYTSLTHWSDWKTTFYVCLSGKQKL